jgi:hypothetical protein
MDNAEFNNSTGGKVVNSIGGALGGAAMGAAIGTAILPGIGTAIGGLIGTVGGVIAGLNPKSVEDVEREQTGGLTYDEFNSFGALAAERGLSMAAGSSKEEFKEVYLEMGYDESDFDAVWANMQNMGTAFDDLANSAFAVA